MDVENLRDQGDLVLKAAIRDEMSVADYQRLMLMAIEKVISAEMNSSH